MILILGYYLFRWILEAGYYFSEKLDYRTLFFSKFKLVPKIGHYSMVTNFHTACRRSLDLCRYILACVWMLEGHTYLKYISSIPTCSCYTTATTSNNTANRRAPCIGVHRYDFYVQTRKLPGTVQVAHLHCFSDRYGCKYLSTDTTQRFVVCQMD